MNSLSGVISKEDRPYQQCTRCLMDTTVVGITFDKQGVCNYCTEFLERSIHIIHEDPVQKEARLNALVACIKDAGHSKPYDCIVGVSGGVDSSWTLVEVKRRGLRPLAVHMDNGWNSELAQNNIANLVRSLDIDLYTHVIDWEEYRTLMQAFFDADVIDIELLYDNAMMAVNYQQASKYGLKYILAGTNQATEGMKIPQNWNWFKYDKRNIKSLARKGGLKKLDTLPAIGTLGFIWHQFIKKNHWISFLDFLPYNKFDALNELEKNYGYKRYPFKHYESVFTRFYQGYLLPKKFGVDKRKIHLSTLVISGQMSREEASEGLNGIPYPSIEDQEQDIQYFIKKMKWSREDLEDYLLRPEVSHAAYPTEKPLWNFFESVFSQGMKSKIKKWLSN
jgi:N-acetyl sugar amidotransferase